MGAKSLFNINDLGGMINKYADDTNIGGIIEKEEGLDHLWKGARKYNSDKAKVMYLGVGGVIEYRSWDDL